MQTKKCLICLKEVWTFLFLISQWKFWVVKRKIVLVGQFSWLVGFSAQIVKCKTTHEYECVLLYVEQNIKSVETCQQL